jgi:REP element-mobilizing transposase RayT
MPHDPLAFFITFSTYGTWLHGNETGSVDRGHNEPGMPFLPVDSDREREEQAAMTHAAYELDAPRRQVVLSTLSEVCRHRGWRLIVAHVRITHVHLVVAADVIPEKVMNDFKAYASRRLTEAGFDQSDTKRWSRHGSTKYIWDEGHLANAINYVLHKQGIPMERFAEDPAWLVASEPSSEPHSDPLSEPRP